MAAVTVSESFVVVEGPRKKEVVHISSANDADTYSSILANPSFGFFVPTKDLGALTAAVEVSISDREVTLNSADLSTSTGVLTLYGF